MANSLNASTVFPQVWATGLQERLTGPTNWKEICEVHMMNDYTLNLPYMSTEFSLQSGTRGTAYSHSDFTITNTVANVDNVARAVKREIIKAKGSKLARRNGIAIVWRPEDFEKLEESMASQGYTFADMALKDGIMDAERQGKYAFGVYHYVSESHTANHVFAGVRKIQQLGLLKSTYGKIFFNPNAVNADGPLSGSSYEARLDYGFNPEEGP